MEAIREWWAAFIEQLLIWLGAAWNRLVLGVVRDWDVRYVIFGLGAVLIIGLFTIWRRKA